MKTILVILFLLLSTITQSQYQVDYNFYDDMTKKEIKRSFKDEGIKYDFDTKLYVDVDSNGHWFLSEDRYTWLVYYENVRALFVFDNKTNKTVKYYFLFDDIDNYWDYYDFYNRVLKNEGNLKWTFDGGDYIMYLTLRPLTSKQMSVYVELKNKWEE